MPYFTRIKRDIRSDSVIQSDLKKEKRAHIAFLSKNSCAGERAEIWLASGLAQASKLSLWQNPKTGEFPHESP